MPETRDLPLLIKAAKAAGELATGYFRGANRVWDKPEGAGPVTQADIAVDTMLRETLTQARPTYGWLSEESEDDAARLDKERVFIVDPIDGTRSFVHGSTSWAHSLAVAEQGRIVAAVVYLPLRDKLYTAALGQGAALNGVALSPPRKTQLTGADVLVARATLAPELWPGGVPEIQRHMRPSLAYRLCLVAEGRFDAMLTLRQSWEWDIAAGALILAEAGAIVTDRAGKPLNFNNAHPQTNGVVTGGRVIHAHLLARLGVGPS